MPAATTRSRPRTAAGWAAAAGSDGIDTQEGVFVLYSAGLGQAALDRLNDKDADPNSVFTRTLIKLMEKPGLSMQELAKTTQSEVKKLAATIGHFQMPAYYDQIDGTLTLARPMPAKAVPEGPGSGRPLTAIIKAKHSGKCIAVGNESNMAPIYQWDCNGNADQKWQF